MVLWKTWFDVRGRFYVGLALVVLFAALQPAPFILLGSLPYLSDTIRSELPEPYGDQAIAELTELRSDYRYYVDVKWFGQSGLQLLPVFAVVLSLGGVMTERATRSVFFTLSLPVSRRRWLLTQGPLVALLVLASACMASLVIVSAGWMIGESYPLGRALLNAVLLTLGSVVWIGATLAVTSITEDTLKTVASVLGLMALAGIAVSLSESLAVFSPWAVGDPSVWERSVPTKALLASAALGVFGTATALRRFGHMDY